MQRNFQCISSVVNFSKCFISVGLKFDKMANVRNLYKECNLHSGNTVNGMIRRETEALETVLTDASLCLKEGGVVAVPTDTIYGIAGSAQKSSAVTRIYNIKKRDGKNPIAICVGDVEQVYRWGKVTVSKELLQTLLPGPVTVVFERTIELNTELNPGTSLVGIRVPDHTFVRELAKLCNEPLALTSANISSEPSCLKVQEFEHLWPHLDLVDGGTIGSSKEERKGSTVVDLSKPNCFTVIRPGSALTRTKEVLHRFGLQEEQKS